jgi:hypothetical protein
MRKQYTPKKSNLIVHTLAGAFFLIIGTCFLIGRLAFLQNAKQLDAPVVETVREEVRKGKRKVLAYIPIVAVPDKQGANVKLKVATYNEENVYHLGDKINVLYDSSSYNECVPNTISDLWGNVIFYFIFSLFGFCPLLLRLFVNRPKLNKP